MNNKYYRTLTIAGSDSGGGAGIQADIKTISACGVFATSAITAITAQNTIGVFAIHPVPCDIIEMQIKAVLDDIGTDSIKIGMLHNSETINTVNNIISKYNIKNIVLDPVMVATSGNRLLEEDAVKTLQNTLIRNARIITPNIPEAEILLGEKITSQEELPEKAKTLADKYNVSVYLKAGHLTSAELIDVVYDNETKQTHFLKTSRVYTKNTHGTGCSLSSALASFLAKGDDLRTASSKAQKYIANAIVSGSNYEIGGGHGPIKHFYKFWE